MSGTITCQMLEWTDECDETGDRLLRAPDGSLYTWQSAPAGSMWFPLPGVEEGLRECGWVGPDGHALVVVTPGGHFMPDSPSRDGTPWQRSGTAPRITCSPSILIPGRYHGWLRDGVLTEC